MQRQIINSIWNRLNRNGINANFEYLFELRGLIEKVVIEDSLTPTEYAELTTLINGLLKSGEVKQVDLANDLNTFLNDLETNSESTLQEIENARTGFPSIGSRLDSMEDDVLNVRSSLEDIYVSIKKFGAVGDGITDNSAAILETIIYCAENGYKVYVPDGVFLIDEVHYLTIPNGKNVVITGNGDNSVIKRMNGVVTAENNRKYMFDFQCAPGAQNVNILVSDVCFDSNFRGNPKPSGSAEYFFQYAQTFRIRGRSSTSKINLVRFQNVLLKNRISDHLSLAGLESSDVKSVYLINCDAVEGQPDSVRGDLTISGAVEFVSMSGCNFQKVATELNRDPVDFKMIKRIDNCTFDFLQSTGGKPEYVPSGNFVTEINNSVVNDTFVVSGTETHVNGGRIRLGEEPLFRNPIVSFKNTEILHTVKSGELVPLNSLGTSIMTFNNVDFKVIGNPSSGYSIRTAPVVQENEKSVVTVENSRFDKKIPRDIFIDRSGDVILKNNTYSSSDGDYAIYTTGNDEQYKPFHLRVDGGDFENINGGTLFQGGAGEIYFVDTTFITPSLAIAVSGQSYNDNPTYSTRKKIVTSEPTGGGIKGDVSVLNTPIEGQVFEWVATRTHPTNANWVESKILGGS